MGRTGPWRRLARLFPLAVILASCAEAPITPARDAEYARNVEEKLSAANPESAAARASGMVEINARGKIISKAAVALERPDNFKAVFSDSFGTSWFMFTANAAIVFYAAPSDGVWEVMARERAAPVKLGFLSVFPGDLVGFIFPSFSMAKMEGAKLEFPEGMVRAVWADRTVELEYDPQFRLKSATVRRKGDYVVRFSYSRVGGALGVMVNSETNFTFTSVESLPGLPEEMFSPPPTGPLPR